MKGTIAFKKLEKLADPAQLKQVIKRLNYDPKGKIDVFDDRSCYMNNIAIVKTLTNQPIAKTWQACLLTGGTLLSPPHGMNGEHTEAVMVALSQSKLTSFMLQFGKAESGGDGDHYFSAFQLDSATVVAAMGWVKIYTLVDYFRGNNGGRFSVANFKALMRQIENGDVEGVAGLCSFLGETRDSTSTNKKLIPQLLSKDIAGTKPKFVNSMTFDLPSN